MKTQILLVSLFLLFTSSNLYSQSFNVPENYEFKDAADYAAYEKDIINAANWLKATPFNEQEEQRNRVSAFVVKWLSGSPTVIVEINSVIGDFDNKNKGMLVLFMASCAKYVLENQYSKDMRAKHKFALREMIAVYKSGIGIVKDKKMEKLIKSDEEGKIDEWLAKNLKIGTD